MCAAQRAGPGVKTLTKWVERVDPTAPVHKCRRSAIETQDNGGVLCRGAHLSTALYLSHLPSSALERSTVMSKRWVVDFYELPGGVTEAILRRTRLTVFHTGIARGRVQLGPYADLPRTVTFHRSQRGCIEYCTAVSG